MARPIVKWSGGKSDELYILKQFIPTKFNVYIEPFFGGGSMFFYLKSLKQTKAIISDIHSDLINFYLELQQGHGNLIYDFMTKYPNTSEIYYRVRDGLSCQTPIERACQFYYLRKTCYRGMMRYNKHGKFNIPFGRYPSISFNELLNPEMTRVFNDTLILNQDFRSVFTKYSSPENFMFLDPPYDSTFKNYNQDFTQEDHIRLANWFKTCKSKCMLIIGETNFISGLYKDYIKSKYMKKYAFKLYGNRINSSNIDNYHLIITNY